MPGGADSVMELIIPAARSAISKRLSRLGMSQQDIAKAMGITQAAVSKYLSGNCSREILELEKYIIETDLELEAVELITKRARSEEVNRAIDNLAFNRQLVKMATGIQSGK